MSVYSKARELADEILASDESLRMADAMALAKDGGISADELNEAINNYNALINDTLDIVRMSLGINNGCGKCGGSCKGE